MVQPLMPRATAVWLIDNTALSFEQIADFCGLHALEIQALADGDVGQGIVGRDPVTSGQLTRDEIERASGDPGARLRMVKSDLPHPKARGARYTPVSKRQDRPNAIAWMLKHHPELSEAQISKLIGTTKDTIIKVRDKTHWNAANLTARNPVTLGLCTELDLEKQVVIARGRNPERIAVDVAPDPLPEELRITPEPEVPGAPKLEESEKDPDRPANADEHRTAAENLFKSRS